MEIACRKTTGARSDRTVLLISVGLRPPSISKTVVVTKNSFVFFQSHIIDKSTSEKKTEKLFAGVLCDYDNYADKIHFLLISGLTNYASIIQAASIRKG